MLFEVVGFFSFFFKASTARGWAFFFFARAHPASSHLVPVRYVEEP